MVKVLSYVPGLCRSCHRCELYCSFHRFKTHNPSLSGIRVISYASALQEPVICRQCGLCMNACPIPGAMKRDTKLGVIEITNKCSGCGRCILSCPYGVIVINPITRKAIKCDYCHGDPVCVKHCPFNALVYVDAEKAAELRRITCASVAGILRM